MIAQAWQQTDWILLGTVLVLLSLSGFLALAETALVRMTRSKAVSRRITRSLRRSARTVARGRAKVCSSNTQRGSQVIAWLRG